MAVMQLHLPDDLIQHFDELAQHAGQSREQVIVEVLEAYLAQVAEEEARLEAAIAAADRGEVVDADAADAEMDAWLLARGVTPEQLAAIGEETQREAEAFYGVSLCE